MSSTKQARRPFEFDGVHRTVSFYESEYLSQLCRLVPSQKRKLLFLFWNRPRVRPELCEGICCRNGVCTAHEAQLPQVLPDKMPPGGKRMARLSDWLPFVTRPKAFDCWLDRSRAADGVPPPPDASAFSAGERKTRASSPLRYALPSPSPKRFLCILLCRHSEIARSTSSPMMSISRVVRCTPVEM